ncbi:hypothetical protein TNCV_4954941 [Trichonephila clavipes]|nr:hypothetical protein TNCV_4954941 [Trichonephila clavipes]
MWAYSDGSIRGTWNCLSGISRLWQLFRDDGNVSRRYITGPPPSYNAERRPVFGSNCQKKQMKHSISPVSLAICCHRLLNNNHLTRIDDDAFRSMPELKYFPRIASKHDANELSINFNTLVPTLRSAKGSTSVIGLALSRVRAQYH